MARPKKADPVKDGFQARIDAVTKETAEDLYVELNEATELTPKVKEELNIALQGKLNVLEQAEHDAAKKPLEPAKVEVPSEEQSKVEKKGSLPSWVKAVSATEEQVMKYQKEGKLYGHNPSKGIAYILSVFMLFFGLTMPVFAAESTDEAVLGNNRWSVQSDGDLVPNANTYNIGSATQYPASIWVGGAEYTSFAAGTDGNWTDQGLTVTLDRAPTKFINTISSGDTFSTGFTVGTGDITFENAQKIDGSTAETIKLIEAGDTLTFGFTGSTITLDSSDGGFQFKMTDETEGQIDFLVNNDTSDYMSITTAANVPTITTTGTCNLVIAPDGGTTTVTGALTASGLVTATGGVTSSTTVTLENAETIVNSTNNTVEVGGGTNTTLSVLDTGTSDSDATLLLRADASANNGDDWQIVADGATNSLLFQNDTSGAMATKFTIPTSGTITFADDIILENGEIIENDTTDDTVSIQSDDAALIFSLYSPLTTGATGTVALQLIADAQTDATDSFEIKNSADGTLTIGNDSTAAGTYIAKMTIDSTGAATVQGSEATAASIALWADNGDNAEDKVSLSVADGGVMTITTGAVNAGNLSAAGLLTMNIGITSALTTDASSLTAGSIVTAGGIACAKQLYVGDDIDMSVNTTGVYDITLKDNQADALSIVRGTTDMMVFDSTTASPLITVTPATTITGTVTANGDMVLGGTTPKLTVGDGGEEDNQIVFDGHSGGTDWHISLDDSADELEIGVGSAPDTTAALTIASATQISSFQQDVNVLGTTPLLTIGDAGDEDAGIQINSDTTDYYIASENSVDALVIGTGSAIGTTPSLTILGQGVTANSTLAVTGTLSANGALAAGYEMVTTSAADPGVGAASIVKLFTAITSDATGTQADAVSLAAGAAGQMKIITLAVDGETTGTSITANFAGATAAALLEDAGDMLILCSDGTEWYIIYNNGATLS